MDSMLIPLAIATFVAASGDNFVAQVPVPFDDDAVEIEDVRLVSQDAIGEDTTDYISFNVYGNDGSTVIFTRSTQDDGDADGSGDLAADTPEKLTAQNGSANYFYSQGVDSAAAAVQAARYILFKVEGSGAGQALATGATILVTLRKVSLVTEVVA